MPSAFSPRKPNRFKGPPLHDTSDSSSPGTPDPRGSPTWRLCATGGNALLRHPRAALSPARLCKSTNTYRHLFTTVLGGSACTARFGVRERRGGHGHVHPPTGSGQTALTHREAADAGVSSWALAGVMLSGMNPSSSTY